MWRVSCKDADGNTVRSFLVASSGVARKKARAAIKGPITHCVIRSLGANPVYCTIRKDTQ